MRRDAYRTPTEIPNSMRLRIRAPDHMDQGQRRTRPSSPFRRTWTCTCRGLRSKRPRRTGSAIRSRCVSRRRRRTRNPSSHGRIAERSAQQYAIDHYDPGVAAYDIALCDLFKMLDDSGLDERTIIVLTANHGQELGEHGFFSPGLHWDTVLQVPLVILDPRRASKGGQTLDALVQTIDVAPTLLDLAGLTVD